MGGTISLIQNCYAQSFNIPPPTTTEKNLPDQIGKVFIITGANSGVGYAVSRLLYSLNGTVYLACRSQSKANDAINSIKSAHPNSTGKLVYLHLDLSDLSTIKPTVTNFLSKETRLDWLNNNAGVMVPPQGSKTAQSHDLQLGTNILGPFLLTKLLLPILKSTAALPTTSPDSVRVSWAGSIAVDLATPKGGLTFNADDSLHDYNGLDIAYAISKTANWYLAHEFGLRTGNRDRVLHNAYNPGNLKSNLTRTMDQTLSGRVIHWILDLGCLHHAVMGAYTEIFAGLGPELTINKDQGGYVIPWGRRSVWNRTDVKDGMREGGASGRLWEWCERETREFA